MPSQIKTIYQGITEQLRLLVQRARATNDAQLVGSLEALEPVLAGGEESETNKQKQLENIVTCLEKAKELIAAYGKQKWSSKIIKKRKTSAKTVDHRIEIMCKDLQKAFAIIYMIILIQCQTGSL